MPQGQQHPDEISLMNSTSATHPSHLPPDHPLQTILVQSGPESNSFRLSRASWGGDGPPPEGFDGSIQKCRLPDGIEGKRVIYRRT